MTQRALKADGRSARAEDVRAQRRSELLAAALRVFGEKGFHQTSITDLVEAAGVARGTFYLYFESKDAVFLALLDEVLAELHASVSGVDVGAGAPSLQAQLETIVGRILRTAESNRALATVLFRQAVGLDAIVDAKLDVFYDSLHAYIAETLRVGVSLGLAREIDVDVVATLVLGSLKQTIERELVGAPPGHVFDVARFAKAIVDYNLNGLAARTRA